MAPNGISSTPPAIPETPVRGVDKAGNWHSAFATEREDHARRGPPRLRQSLSVRLLGRVLLFSACITLILTLLQLYVQYRQDVSALESQLDQISRTNLESLAERLWALDENQLRLQLAGILRLPGIRAVEVREAGNEHSPLVVKLGERSASAPIVREYPLLYSVRGQNTRIGTLYVQATLEDIQRRLFSTAWTILVNQAGETFLVSLFIAYIFHNLVTRHLFAIANFVDSYRINDPPAPLQLRRPPLQHEDELQRVVEAFNALSGNLQAAYRNLHNVNDQLTRDVAARRQIEAVLREREARIRRLIDADIIGIFLWDIEGPVLEANDAFLHMVGYDREDLIAGRLCWTDLTPPEWRERDVQQLEPELERTGRLQPFEKEYFRKDGSRVPVLIGLASFDKTTTQGVAFVLDLTERKRAEQALHRSEAYLAEAQRMTHTGSWAWDPHNDQVLYWSEEMFRIMGLDPQDCVPTGPRFSQLIHPEDRDRLDAQVQKSLRQKVDYVVEHRIVRPDQTVRDIQTIGHPVLNGGGEVVEYVGIVMDVTERKRAEQERERLRRIEEELARINRVSMMGELTASLAHEIKQPMAAAVSNAEACLQWLAREQPDLEETREAAREMVKEARRAAEIITRLRSLFRKEEISREVLEINQVIIETVSLVREEADRRSIPVRTELDSPLPRISADRVQLQQVLINLMLNGMEAMDSTRGELTIRSQLDHEGRALISVTDMGTGLPAGQRDKIFDAFFTTKPQGTGMGLAISRSIIESHGGRLWANANTGRGTTFHFTLPAAPADGSLVTNEPSFTT